jgi:FkbM family methyltransferase
MNGSLLGILLNDMNYYITHSDKNYVEVAEKLFKSLELNSNLKILYYTVNFEYENKFSNVIPIHYQTNFKQTSGFTEERNINNNSESVRANLLFLKSKICNESLRNENDNFCYLDADCIAVENCDKIFESASKITSYPLLGENCHEYMIYYGKGNPFLSNGSLDLNLCLEASLLKKLNIPIHKRTSLYRQTNILLFNKKCLNIINEWEKICYNSVVTSEWNKYACFNDETVLNCILWRDDMNDHLSQISINIPAKDDDGNFVEPKKLNDFINAYKNPKDNDFYYGTFCKIPSKDKINNIKFLHGRVSEDQFEYINKNLTKQKNKIQYFVTHSDEKYLSVCEKLFESLELNSELQILYYTVNFKYKNRFKNVIPIYYEIDLKNTGKSLNYSNVFNVKENEVVNFLFLKPEIYNAALKYGDNDYCYIDADCLALKNCDEIFKETVNIVNYPLLPKGPHDYIIHDGRGIHFNNDGTLNLDLCLESDLLKFIGSDSSKRTSLYRTAHIVLFNNKCKEIIQECKNICNTPKVLENWKKYAIMTDETVINCVLWKYNYYNNLDQISIHIPSLENNSFVSNEKFDQFIEAFLKPNEQEYMYENFTRIPNSSKIENIKFLHGKTNDNQFKLIKEKIFMIKTQNEKENKSDLLLIIHSSSLGDTIAATPVLRKLYKSYNKKIDIVTYHPEIFKKNKYVNIVLDYSSTNLNNLSYKQKFETFLGVGGIKNNLGVEKKHNTIDIRQFHAIDLGFMLHENEMEYDFLADDYININNLPEKYVCIHAANTWPSRTYSDEKFQQLIDKLNNNNIPVVLIGKNSIERGYFIIDKQTKKLSIKNGLDLTNILNLSQCWHVINKSICFITMDSGLLHLAGTTDTNIIQLGSSINNKLRAPYRNGSQDYKYKYISGSCNVFCASDIKYGVKEWGNIQGVPPLINCLENKNTFECHPNSVDIYNYIIQNFINLFDLKIDLFNLDTSDINNVIINYRSKNGNINNCRVKLLDIQTKTILYEGCISIEQGIDYWTSVGNISTIISNDIRVLFFDKDVIIFDKIYKIHKQDRKTPVSHLCFNYDLHSSNLYEIYICKDYEYKDIKIETDDVVVDIGSNLSTFIHYALENNASKVYSCEPASYCIKIINNYFKNNEKVIINPIAISNKNDFCFIESLSDGCGSNKLTYAEANNKSSYINCNTEKVKTQTFKTFIENNDIKSIDFLKVDCEGSEVFIFVEENKDFFKNKVHKIAIEYHNKEKDNIISYLKSLNYEVYEKNNSFGEVVIGMIYAKNKSFNKQPITLFLAPHLSTGGSPAYLKWLIEENIKKNIKPVVIEYCNYGAYEVQKKEIINLVGKDNFHTFGNHWDSDLEYDEKSLNLIKLIEDINPSVIHLNEISEIFSLKKMTSSLFKYLYSKNRKFKLVETSHTSEFNFHNKYYLPDRFDFCTSHHLEKSEHLNVEKNIVEMIIPNKLRPNRSETLKKLNLSENYFHVLNVGLFTKDKNQKYLFNLAERLQDKKVVFHFVGNTCYYDDCEITEKQKVLSNCVLWGERNDVDIFMSCMDLFAFPSLKELNPISIKEALSWSMPCYINYLETYGEKYDNNPLINYIQNDNLFKLLNNLPYV